MVQNGLAHPQALGGDLQQLVVVDKLQTLFQRQRTFGTGTELLNSLRLMFSRLSSYPCPQCGRWLEPSLAVAAEKPLLCPQCAFSSSVLL